MNITLSSDFETLCDAIPGLRERGLSDADKELCCLIYRTGVMDGHTLAFQRMTNELELAGSLSRFSAIRKIGQ